MVRNQYVKSLLRLFLARNHNRQGRPTFEQKRLAFVQSKEVAALFDSGGPRGLFVGHMIRHIIMESVFDEIKRAVSILSVSSKDTTIYGVSKSVSEEVQRVESESDRLAAHNSFFGWACLSLMRLWSRRSKAVSESSKNKNKWDELYKIMKSFRTLRHEVGAEGSLSVVDKITEHRNKGGLFLPPYDLLSFTTKARSLIKEHVHVTRIYDDVLIDAAEAVNSYSELIILWETWYSKFNPDDKVHGPVICRALLLKLTNSVFGVVLKEVNARYTSLATNKKMKFALREHLKVSSNNAGSAGGGKS
jgi:hypothetical protein